MIKIGSSWRRSCAFLFVSSAVVLTLWTLHGSEEAQARTLTTDSATVSRGAGVFSQNCSACHGRNGKGDGPVAKSFDPPPVDFTKGVLRHGSGDDYIVKAISLGVPGTAMTGFKGRLSDADITAVAAYVKSLKKP